MFSLTMYSIDEEGGSAQIELALSNPSSIDITVLVKDVPKSAISEQTCVCNIQHNDNNLLGNEDYTGGLYTVTIPAGVTSVPFDVPIINDAILEGNEKFNLIIVPRSLPERVTRSSPGRAKVIVVDDDSS